MKIELRSPVGMPSPEKQSDLLLRMGIGLASSDTVKMNAYDLGNVDVAHLFSPDVVDAETALDPVDRNALKFSLDENDSKLDARNAAQLGLSLMKDFIELGVDLVVQLPHAKMHYPNRDLRNTQVWDKNNSVSLWSAANDMARNLVMV